MVIGVSPDPPNALKKFRAKYNLTFVLLSDPDHQVLERYSVWQRKKMYGKTYFGVVRSHYVIDEAGKIIDVQLNVSPAESVSKAVAMVLGTG